VEPDPSTVKSGGDVRHLLEKPKGAGYPAEAVMHVEPNGVLIESVNDDKPRGDRL
jgi:hypothetical protein